MLVYDVLDGVNGRSCLRRQDRAFAAFEGVPTGGLARYATELPTHGRRLNHRHVVSRPGTYDNE